MNDIVSEVNEDELRVSPIYYAALGCKTRGQIHQGGQWSGKTVNILIALASIATNEKKRIITVTSESMPHLRGGAMRDFETYVYPYFSRYITDHHKTLNKYTFTSGSIIEFKSYETERSALGAKRHYLYINEANSFPWMIFFQLNSRTDVQTIIDYNPAAKFWAHDELIGTKGWTTFYSDHRNNTFLSEERHREIENIKDPQLWLVYARGITGNVEGVIYPDWQLIPDELFHQIVEQEDKFFGGLDFGYTNDPTAAVKMVRTAAGLYVHEMFYETGLSAKQIVNNLNSNGWGKTTAICCDSADPAMISEIKRLGIKGAKGALKGQGSILAGINHLKGQKVFVTESSKNIRNEMKRYVWEKDKNSGKLLNEPIDQYNHGMDAIRYGHYTMYFRQ